MENAQRLGLARPPGARGFLPLVIAALGAARGIAGAISANQQKQRNKGFIDANYRLASQRLGTNQANTREGEAESLNARGLSPIAGAMASGGTATNLGQQTQGRMEQQFGLERQDLDNQHTQALSQNSADYSGALLNSAVGAAGTAMQAYGAGQDLNAIDAMKGAAGATGAAGGASATASPVASAMMSGSLTDPSSAHMGVDPVDPFGHPGSAWNPANRTLNGAGLSNADFNTGSA